MITAMYAAQAALAVANGDSSSPLPDPETVRQTAHEVLVRTHFKLDAPADVGDGFVAFVWRLFVRMVVGILDSFYWLHGMSPVLAWLFVAGLCVTLAIVLGHMAWTIGTLFRRNRHASDASGSRAREKIDPIELVRQAESARARGDYILGVRLLFRACLGRLEQIEGKKLRLGATNRELLNRYRSTPLYEWLARFVSVIDMKWYGSEPCLAADFAFCHEAFERICILAVGMGNAQRA